MKTHGKAFVLFTSYGSMLNAAERSKDFLRRNNITMLVQGEGKNRSMMLKEFREDIDSVIFGTTSFWMGVDVPGEALSNVIITKLPFSVPTEPLVEARLDKLKAEGRNSFMDYSLPEAVIRFKQGVGRLIRSKTDRGIIVILDNRVLAKAYGRIFINSLPPLPHDHRIAPGAAIGHIGHMGRIGNPPRRKPPLRDRQAPAWLLRVRPWSRACPREAVSEIP